MQKITACLVLSLCLTAVLGQAHNPSILQDSRYEPKVDGTFGFLYRTEDGIAHGAKSNGDGIISGRFTYTDPTGLKVNFNYNAGSRVTPGYNYEDQNQDYQPKTSYETQQGTSYNPPQEKYQNQRETYSSAAGQQAPANDNYYQPNVRQTNQNDLYSNYS